MNIKDVFAERLRIAREGKGLTMDELAQKLKMNKSTIQRYESGVIANVKLPVVEAIAKILDVSPDWLIGKSAIQEVSKTASCNCDILDKGNIHLIPIYESVSAGLGAYADNHICGYEPIYLEHQCEADETIAIAVSGDSMYPKIEDKDIVIVHKQEYFNNGDIVVAVVCGEDNGFVKRAFRNENKLTLESINPIYPPMIFTGTKLEEVKIMGVVKKIIKSV